MLNYLGSFKASMPRVFVDGEIWYEIEKLRVVQSITYLPSTGLEKVSSLKVSAW